MVFIFTSVGQRTGCRDVSVQIAGAFRDNLYYNTEVRISILNSSVARQKQAGFTIPELLVTIVFIGFAFVAITQLYLSIQRIQEQTSWLQSASHAAQTEVESLRNNNYSQLIAGQTIDFSPQLPTTLPGPRVGTVNISEPQAGLKRVDVTVSYSDHGTPQQVELTSLIGIIGISQ